MSKNALHHLVLELRAAPCEEVSRALYEQVLQRLIAQGIAIMRADSACYFIAHRSVDIRAAVDALSPRERAALSTFCPHGELMAPASQEQVRNLYHSEVMGLSVWNIQHVYECGTQVLDLPTLEKALATVAQHQDVLKTHFLVLGERWIQVIAQREVPEVGAVEAATLAQFQHFIAEERNSLLPVHRAPLFRCRVSREIEGKWYLGFVAHHSLADAFSTTLLFDQLMSCYRSLLDRQPPQLATARDGGSAASAGAEQLPTARDGGSAVDAGAHQLPPVGEQYWQYALKQFDKSLYQGAEALHYWQQQLSGGDLAMRLPYARDPRGIGAAQMRIAGSHAVTLPAPLSEKIERFHAEQAITYTQLFTAALNLLLVHGMGNARAVIQSLHSQRDRAALLNTIGEFSNVLFTSYEVETNTSVIELLRATKERSLRALRYAKVDFSRLLALSGLENYQTYYGCRGEVMVDSANLDAGVQTGAVEYGRSLFAEGLLQPALSGVGAEGQAVATLFFQLLKSGGRMLLVCAYRKFLFDAEEMRQLSALIVDVVERMLAAPGQQVERLLTEIEESLDCLRAQTGRYRLTPDGDAAVEKPFFTECQLVNKVNDKQNDRPVFWVHGAFGDASVYIGLARRVPRPFYGIQARGLFDTQKPLESVETIAAFYRRMIQAIQVQGPYDLGGYSIGGTFVYEVARQLQERGEEVASLTLVDALYPNHHSRLGKDLYDHFHFVAMGLIGMVFRKDAARCAAIVKNLKKPGRSGDRHYLLDAFADLCRDAGVDKSRQWIVDYIDRMVTIQRGYGIEDYRPEPLPGSIANCHYFKNRAGLFFGQRLAHLNVSEVDPLSGVDYWSEWCGLLPNLEFTPIEVDNHIEMLEEENTLKVIGDYCRALYQGVQPVARVNEPICACGAEADYKGRAVRYLTDFFARALERPASDIQPHRSLEHYGLDSFAASTLTTQLQAVLGGLSITVFYECQTLAALADYLLANHGDRFRSVLDDVAPAKNFYHREHRDHGGEHREDKKEDYHRAGGEHNKQVEGVAIIGLSGRYPKARNMADYWRVLRDGVDCVDTVPRERWDWREYYSEDRTQTGAQYSKWGGFIEDIDKFDALFFNISPREAEFLDPQERLFLEQTWTAVEDAGYSRDDLRGDGSVSVYVGVMYGEYQFLGVESSVHGNRRALGGSYASIANRVSYVFDLHGPSMSLDSACSSSLTCIHMACQDLRHGVANMAIAGGVNLSLHPNKYLMLSAGQFISSKGHCESFGEGGDGFIPAEGVGVVLLKRLRDAERDGDPIYGVITGSAVNHGGKTNGYTVPNPVAQQQVVRRAIEAAGIDPRQINYIEAHGTGTRIGDPIEIAGLTKAFRECGSGIQKCWIGSAKSNLGHCEAAAGIAGLAKVLLQMQHGRIVPSLHSSTLNAHIDFSATPFIVNQELRDWERPVIDGKACPRAAGISSFGAGGSNAHIIVEEYIPENAPRPVENEGPALIVLSARNPERLREIAGNLCTFLTENRENTSITLRDLAYTLQVGREAMSERLGLIVRGLDELGQKLQAFVNGEEAGEDIFRGRLPIDRDPLHFFADDDELQAALSLWIERGKFAKLLDLWVRGLPFDWRKLYPGARPRRVSLPTYPFARERHWATQTDAGRGFEKQPLQQERGLFMAAPVWIDKPVAEQSRELNNARHTVIFCGFAERADAALMPGEVSRIHLHSTEKNLAAGFLDIAGQLFSIIRDLVREVSSTEVLLQVLVPAQGQYQLYSALSGLLQTTHREQPGIRTQLIQVDWLENPQTLWSKLSENRDSPEDIYVRYQAGLRQALRWNALPESAAAVYNVNPLKAHILNPLKALPAPWRDGGNYLITGGAGGLGLIFAREIAQQARGTFLVLVGRSELNAGQQAAIRQIESLGAAVEYRRADIGEFEQTQALIDYLQQRGKPLNGIIHAAGIIRDNFIQKKSLEEFRAVMAPKVLGTVHLDQATRGLDLDFFILFSSAAGVFGNAGQTDYATANAFMDAYAHYRNAVDEAAGRTFSVNWPLWAEGGMGVDSATGQAIEAAFGMVPMATGKGVRALEWMLAHGEPRLLVIEGDVEKIKRQLPGCTVATVAQKREDSQPLEGQRLQALTLSRLQTLFGKVIKLAEEKVDPAEPFEHYGIDSVMITQLNRELAEVFGEISKTLFFECKRLSEVAAYLVEQYPGACAAWCECPAGKLNSPLPQAGRSGARQSMLCPTERPKRLPLGRGANDRNSDDPIAIIGLSGHYAEAATLENFWENLRQGKDCIREIPNDRWPLRDFYEPDIETAINNGKSYCKWGSFIETFAQFDPLFFNISPREAQCMDPQERHLLQCAWEVVEDAGYTRASLAEIFHGRVGVFAGVTSTGFDLHGPALWRRGKTLVPRTSFSSIANRISYFLDLNGPSIAIDTMCSSSLTALHEACGKIRRGECEAAIVGAVNLYSHPVSYQNLSANRMLSVEGRCKSFARGGDGFVPGEGVGAVLLKPLSRARADGDHIYGLVRATQVNHGGKTNGYTVPNPRAQADLIREALHKAKVHPRAVSYFEAHGTGTELGDPIEITGMTQAFRQQTSENGFCALGSVKSNIGHLEAAAGMAGLTKILLQMKHKQIVPSLHARDTNPNINFADTPFVVQQTLTDWKRPVVDIEGKKRQVPRIACISSFGAGGANAHALIQEYKAYEELQLPKTNEDKPRLILLSARNGDRLKAMAGNLLGFMAAHEQSLSLMDIAYTLQVGREAMDKRLGVLAGSLGQLREKLQVFLESGPVAEGVYQNAAKRNRERIATQIAERTTAEEFGEQNVRSWIEAGDYEKLIDLWTRGYSIDWRLLYAHERPRRISLPVYPFAGERYWFELEEENLVESGDVSEKGTWDGFSYLPRWERQAAIAAEGEPTLPKTILVVCTEPDSELRDAMVQECKRTWTAAEMITLAVSENLSIGNIDVDRVYFIASGYGNIDTPEQLARSRQCNELSLLRLLKILMQRVESRELAAGGIDFFLLTFDRCPSGANVVRDGHGITSRFRFRGARLARRKNEGIVGLRRVFATTPGGMHRRRKREVISCPFLNPYGGGLAGLACSVAQAEHRIRVRCIDLSLEAFRQPASRSGLFQQLHREVPSARGETVRLEHGARYIQTFCKLSWNTFDRTSGFEPGGAYIILGGSGVVGGLVTRRLILKYRARVAWIGRTPVDTPAIQERLSEYGGMLHYVQADALDLAALEKGIAEVKATLGRIDGALFAGKVFTLENPLAQTSELEFNDVVDIKTRGVLNFYLALRHEHLKFLCYFSSVQAFSFLPAKESVGYAAGITAADALVASLRDKAAFPIGVINWGYWQASVADTTVEPGLARHFRFIDDAFGFRFLEKFLAALRDGALDRVMCVGVRDSANALINCPPDALISISASASGGRLESGLETVIASLQAEELNRQNEIAPVWNLPTRQQRNTLENWAARLLHAQLARCRGEKIPAKYQRWLTECQAIEQPAGSDEALWSNWAEYRESLRHPELNKESSTALNKESSTDLNKESSTDLNKESSTDLNKELQAAANLVDICLSALPDILSGRKTAQGVLFPGGSIKQVEALYRGNALADFFNIQLSRIVEAFVRSRNSAVRLLEIGAGTGSTSAVVLQQLLPHLERVEDYCYTDLSEVFLAHARNCYGPWFPKMSYKRLDIQQPLDVQGIATDAYDVVIATNVLHATRNIRQTIRHAKSALKRNGILLINEVVEKSIVGTVTFGLLDGWWLYEDEALRLPGSPLLDLENWRRLLEEEGFRSVTAATGAAEALGQEVIVAESDGCIWRELTGPVALPEREQTDASTSGQAQPAINDVKAVVLNALIETVDGAGAVIESDEPFSDYGVDSILGVSFVNRLNQLLGLELNATVLFEYTTVDQLSDYIVENRLAAGKTQAEVSPVPPSVNPKNGEAISIIGYSGRFPGSGDIDAFWQRLLDGRGAVAQHTTDDSSALLGVLLEDRDCFDPLFFNISPLEAESMNRHQRLLLQEGWKALEDAGCNPKSLKENPVGIFVGAEPVGTVQASFTGASDALIASRLSYFLGLRGPAMVVNTGCSSSGTALHLACQSLRNGESDLALVAGAHVSMDAEMTAVLAETGMLSPSGVCRSFDDAADGTLLSEGLGVVVLKRLGEAVADGHTIHGVIIASGLNQDGASNGITAPSGTAQEALIFDVYQRFGVNPEHITYIEAHGTGTKLGDPVEANALTRAFRRLTDKRHYCAVGSAKAHIGHTSASSAVIGLIKILLSMRHRQLPALPNFTKLNQRIEFEQSPFYINTMLSEWRRQAGPLTAALSSFGHSGTNAHFVIREYLEEDDSTQIVMAPQPQVIVLSARTRQQLKENTDNLRVFAEKNPSIELRDLAYTLQVGREAMEERIAFMVANRGELMEKLALFVNDNDLVPEDNETAQAWLQGQDVDWQALHGSPRPRLIRLPTYSFARELYPIKNSNGSVSDVRQWLHPLVQCNTSNREGFRFSSRFTGEEFYFADHLVHGNRTMPGVVYLEMARAAVERHWGTSPQRLQDIVWLRPIIVGDEPLEIHIGLRQSAEGHIEYDIYSEHPAEGRQVHGSGLAIVFEESACSETKDIAELEKRFATLGDKGPGLADCRDAFASMGVHYGPGFQCIEALRADAGEVLAKLVLPAAMQEEGDHFLLHPSLMDCALQAGMGLTLACGIEASWNPQLPFALDRVDILAPCTAVMWVWVRRSAEVLSGNVEKLDLDLCNEAGQISVRIRGLCSRALTRDLVNPEAAPEEKTVSLPSSVSLLTPLWRRVHTPEDNLIQPRTDERVLVVGGSEAQRQAIREIFPAARQLLFNPSAGVGQVTIALSRSVDHLIWIAPESEEDDPADEKLIESQQQGVLHLFQLIKSMLAADYGLEDLCWTLITTQARAVNAQGPVFPAHAGVHGLAGSMAKEFPHWKIRLLDMEAGVGWPCREMFSLPFDRQGDALFYCNGEWFAEELVSVESVPAAPGLYKRGGVYVVIGGAGGVGEVWSEWVIEKFQAQVIWLGRRTLDSAIQAGIDRLSKLGPAPVYIRADATDAAALRKAFEQIKRDYGRIDGVVHSAIVLLDKGLVNMSVQDFEAGLKAKVDICVRLAQVCQGEALDFVLFFSSLQSFTKAPGQSNYAAGCTFADSFSRLLESRWACPVKVMNWGYWGEVGVVRDAGYRERMERAGLESINREEGMEGLESLLAGPFEQMALVKINRDERQPLSPLGEREWVMTYPERIPRGLEMLEGEQ